MAWKIIDTIKTKEFKKQLEQEIVERLKKLDLPKSIEEINDQVIDDIIDNYNICFTYQEGDCSALMCVVGLTDKEELILKETGNVFNGGIDFAPISSLSVVELIDIALFL